MKFKSIEELIEYFTKNDLYKDNLRKTRIVCTVVGEGKQNELSKFEYPFEISIYVDGKKIISEKYTDTSAEKKEPGFVKEDRYMNSYEFDRYLISNKNFLEAILTLNKIEDKKLIELSFPSNITQTDLQNKYISYHPKKITGKLISIREKIISEQPRVVLVCETRELANNDYYSKYYDYTLMIDGVEGWKKRTYNQLNVKLNHLFDYELFSELEYGSSISGDYREFTDLTIKVDKNRVSLYDGEKCLYPEKKFNDKKLILSSLSMNEAVQKILSSEKSLDPDSISLYDIVQLFRNNSLYTRNSWYLDTVFNHGCVFIIGNRIINVDGKEINTPVEVGKTKDGQLYIKYLFINYLVGSEGFESDRNVVAKTIDDLKNHTISGIPYIDTNSSNTDFKISFGRDSITIGNTPHQFMITFRGDSNTYSIESYESTSECKSCLMGKEDKIFKHIFVRIDDCPKWIRHLLREIREKQLQSKMEKLLSSLKNLKNSITNDFTREDSNNKTR